MQLPTLRSAREIGMVRRAGAVVAEALQAAGEKVAPGISTDDLDNIVEDVFRRRNAIPLFKGYPGKTPFPASTCISVNEEVVHGIPGQRVLQEGDIVSIDTGCKLDGWCADSAFTFGVGTISVEKERLLSVTQESLQLAIRLFGERPRWSDVARELAAFVREQGFSVVEEFSGHGIGRNLHEAPQAPNFEGPELWKNDFLLRPGLVLAIEPMVNCGTKKVKCLSDRWTQVTADGRPSAHFEHTVARVADGVEILTLP